MITLDTPKTRDLLNRGIKTLRSLVRSGRRVPTHLFHVEEPTGWRYRVDVVRGSSRRFVVVYGSKPSSRSGKPEFVLSENPDSK